MKKKIVLVIIFIAVLSLIGGFALEFLYDSKAKPESKPKEEITKKEEEPKEPFSGQSVEISKSSPMFELFDMLSIYTKKYYDDKTYLSYSKKNDMYFISLADLNKLYGFDISVFKDEKGNVCDIEESGVYFDPDNHLNLEYTSDFDPIIPSLIGCGV